MSDDKKRMKEVIDEVNSIDMKALRRQKENEQQQKRLARLSPRSGLVERVAAEKEAAQQRRDKASGRTGDPKSLYDRLQNAKSPL